MKPYEKCPECREWCYICLLAMKPKVKQLNLFDNIQNTNYNDGNNTANFQQDSGDKSTIKR